MRHEQDGDGRAPGSRESRAVNGGTSQVPRLVVGISGSRASWWALAWAVGEARRRGAHLLLVHVFRPPLFPAPAPAPYGQAGPSIYRDPYADRAAHGHVLIRTAIDQAVGRMPGGIAVEERVSCGRAAAELASLARGADMLVLGSRYRGRLQRLMPGSLARACARRAGCPVLIVPEPSPRALPASLLGGEDKDHRLRWVPRRRARTAA
jgi:nucleotide-binding universal stress UspA family protein